MHGEELPRRQALRLVQPFHVGDDVAFRSGNATGCSPAPMGQRGSKQSSTQRTRARATAHGNITTSLDSSKDLSCLTSSSEVLLSFPARSGGAGGVIPAATVPSVPSSRAHHPCDREIPLSSSSVQSGSSSVDRLAALFQQFQISQGGCSHAPERRTTENSFETVASTPAPPKGSTFSVSLAHPTRRGSANVGSGVASEGLSQGPRVSAILSTPPRSPQPASEGDQFQIIRPREDVVKRADGGSPTRLTPTAHRSANGESVERSVSPPGAAAPSLSSRSQPARATVAAPPTLSRVGIPALMDIAVRVWAALGFFEMRPKEGVLPNDGSGVVNMSYSVTGPSRPEDAESFLCGLQEYLSFYHAESPGASATTLEQFTVLLRNGLWRVLFNAVFYCLTALDRRRYHRGPISGKATEACTGGAGAAYEMFHSSTTSDAYDEEDSEVPVSRRVPVRLVWKHPNESHEELMARCVRDTVPPSSPLWSVLPSTSRDRDKDSVSMERSDHRGTWSLSPRLQLDKAYGGRLRTALPIAEWYFVLHSLTQIGYQRDAFYLQTPYLASPPELLLALLWLTQRYRLLAVVEYVELNRRYPFLLRYHVSDAFLCGSASAAGAPQSVYATARERLIYQLSCASAWPPVSFDENATIATRFAQLERCLGKSTSSGESSALASLSEATGFSTATLYVRRLMAIRRLLGLSFNRLHHALQRQAEQVSLLGVDTPLDVQLCRKEHHALYEEVIAGLTYVQATSQRLQTATDHLAKAGSLVAFLLRYEESTVPAEEVLLALEEDSATWLTRGKPAEGGSNGAGTNLSNEAHAATEAHRWRRAVRRGALPISHSASEDSSASATMSAASLAQGLSTLRGTRVRATLTEMWRRLLRRSHVAPQTVQPESLRFLLDAEAQQMQETRVRENMRNRYSLQAALAAELAVLGYQKEQRILQCRQSGTSLRGEDDGGSKVAHSRVNTRGVEDSKSGEVGSVHVTLPPLDLVTSAGIAFAQLRSEEAVYGSVTLGSAELQLAEVGEPAANSTTSARLELERLQVVERHLGAQLRRPASTAARSEYCKELLQRLLDQYGLRMATPLARGPTGQLLASVK